MADQSKESHLSQGASHTPSGPVRLQKLRAMGHKEDGTKNPYTAASTHSTVANQKKNY